MKIQKFNMVNACINKVFMKSMVNFLAPPWLDKWGIHCFIGSGWFSLDIRLVFDLGSRNTLVESSQ